MKQPSRIVMLLLLTTIHCKPFDDGKYSPKKYNTYSYDDGKYYRPLDEGKYIPGDEGRYTYIYNNTLYPALPYNHVTGPSGGFGGNGGAGGGWGNGPNSSDRNGYIGFRIYADRYPYIAKVINALVEEYVSPDRIYGDTPEGSANRFNKIRPDNESAVKCRFLSPKEEESEFVTQYPPRVVLNKTERKGTFYSFKGSKFMNSVENTLKSKIKLEYEVIVRVVEITE